MTRLSSLKELRYPGHDTLGCFPSPLLYRIALNSPEGRDSVLCSTNRDNIVEGKRLTSRVTCTIAEKGVISMVFVINKNKKTLTPCHPAKARILLKARKATIHKKYPFTIRLKELKSDDIKDDFRLKIDYGSRYTGLAVLKNNRDVIWLAQVNHRTDIKKKLDDRRSFRRRRRS
ncbi:RRXRR domain-containing protein, partial [Methanohalobium sp.]|uniref:RRXRR domain-containing protein n=1 Tax=Methanohalobium sp. TaxID=2837493 RepID=UPI0025DBF8FD